MNSVRDKHNPKIVLFATPGVLLRWREDGKNICGVRTNEPKLTQHVVKTMLENGLRANFPDIKPKIDIIDMKTMAPEREEKYGEVAYGDRSIEKYRLGAPFVDVKGQINDANIIGLTCNFTQEARVVSDFIAFAKQENPNAYVIVGGSDAMARPEYFLTNGADAVVLGEGEKIGHRLIAAWAGELKFEEVSGIAYMENGNINLNPRRASDVPQPSDFVFPTFYPLLLKEYNESSEGVTPEWAWKEGYMMSIETSRGCTNACSFCTTPMLRGRYRAMPLEQEIELLKHYKKYGVKTLLEWEDNRLARLNSPGGREDVITAFRARREMGFLWEFSNGLEIGKFVKNDGSIDKELIQTLYYNNYPVGCFRAFVPLESVRHDGEEPLYKKLKPWDLEKEILREIVRTGVPVLTIGLIIGIPSETKESLELTYTRCEEIKQLVEEENKQKKDTGKAKTSVVFTLFLDMLLPGSLDYARFNSRLKYSIEEHPELMNFYTSNVKGDVFSPEEMTKIREEMARKLNGEEAMELWNKRGKYPYPFGNPVSDSLM